ncbi:TRAP transporter substrate-binding protein DctP [Pseudooceanicola sp. MF1-13]|uniref:TRAP transporter substrate-binding protein DctP n=1 Tax=Pseudooceanicola sp. MF1-13 TaxID=3379095 RepID=UPI00389240A9
MTYFSKLAYAAALTLVTAQTINAETLSFTSSSPPDATPSKVIKEWADKLSEATNGDLEIEFYWQQSLSKLGDNLEAVADGLADMGVVVPAYSRQKLPLAYLSSTATGSGDPWVISKAWRDTRDAFPIIAEEEEAQNVKFLAIESIGPVIFVGNKFYKTPEDFDNATMRLSSHYAFAAQESGWNVNPARVQSPETYTSLEKGTITGATTYANQLFTYKLNEVTDYITRIGLGQHSNMYYINLDVWNGLSDEHKKAIEDSLPALNEAFAKAEIDESNRVFDEVQADAKYPMQVYELSEEEQEVWSTALAPSYDNNIGKAVAVNPRATEVAEAFRSELKETAETVTSDGYPWK